MTEYGSQSKRESGPFLLQSNRDMWQSLNKIIEKEENLLFKTKKLFSLFTQPHTFSDSSLSPSRCHFLLLHSPLKLQAKLQPLATISAPNRERRAFLESWSAWLRVGLRKFRFGWTSFSLKFRGYGVLGDMMGGFVSFLLCDDYLWRNLLKACWNCHVWMS